MGLHPGSVKENYGEELRIVEEWFEKRPFVAVGETGLDFYWDLTYSKEQYEVFQQQIEWAAQFDIPVVIHSRNSIDECIGMIAENQKGNLKGIFHCFSGSVEQAKKIIDLNFYLGIGGVLTFKKSGLDCVVEQLDLGNIVLETDAPYLAPVPYRGKRCEPAYVKDIADVVSQVKNCSLPELSAATCATAHQFFPKLG